MPSKYPVCTPREIHAILTGLGFVPVSQKGSHIKYTDGKRTCIVPNHKEVYKGTLKSVLEQAGITLDDFVKLLKS